jgi:hypothetical protein
MQLQAPPHARRYRYASARALDKVMPAAAAAPIACVAPMLAPIACVALALSTYMQLAIKETRHQ